MLKRLLFLGMLVSLVGAILGAGRGPLAWAAEAPFNEKVPSIYAARMNPEARRRALEVNGGTRESEEAVLKGLRWLVKMQNPDGTWGPKSEFGYRPAVMTGLALLSFLGHGELNNSAEFGATIEKAIGCVRKSGLDCEGRLSMGKGFIYDLGPRGVVLSSAYAHAVVTQALAEYDAFTGDRRDAKLLAQATRYILDGQGSGGGWGLFYQKSDRGSLPITVRQMEALRAVRLTGLKIDGVDAALVKAVKFLQSCRDGDGSFCFLEPKENEGVIILERIFGQHPGEGAFGLYLGLGQRETRLFGSVDYLLKNIDPRPKLPTNSKDSNRIGIDYRDQSADLSMWLYDTQACFLAGDSRWRNWNHLFAPVLIKNQSPDGSWPVMASRGLDDMQVSDNAITSGWGPFYRTTFCVLTLESYYRELPEN